MFIDCSKRQQVANYSIKVWLDQVFLWLRLCFLLCSDACRLFGMIVCFRCRRLGQRSFAHITQFRWCRARLSCRTFNRMLWTIDSETNRQWAVWCVCAFFTVYSISRQYQNGWIQVSMLYSAFNKKNIKNNNNSQFDGVQWITRYWQVFNVYLWHLKTNFKMPRKLINHQLSGQQKKRTQNFMSKQ